MNARDLALFYGAGASAHAPSRLARFGELRRHIASSLGIPNSELLGLMAPEAVLRLLDLAGLDVAMLLWQAFAQRPVNDLHRVAANVLSAGGVVWTTNFDTLIEDAANWLPATSVAAYGDSPDGEPGGRLYKPHGSLPRIDRNRGSLSDRGLALLLQDAALLFQAGEVVGPLDGAWRRALTRSFEGRHVILVGYAGADVDLRLPLAIAFERAKSVTWYENPSWNPELSWRFPSLRPAQIQLVARPVEAFLQWGHENGLVDRRTTASRPTEGAHLANVQVRRHRVARAELLFQLGERRTALGQYGWAFLRAEQPGRAVRLAIRLILYGAKSRLRAVLALWARTPLGTPGQRTAARFTCIILIRKGRYRRAERLARMRTRARDCGLDDLINHASALRMVGNLDECTAVASRALDCALSVRTDRRDPERFARAAWEYSYALRWRGRLDDAEEHLRCGYDTVAGPKWVAWKHFERGCLAIHRAETSSALDQLDIAASAFQGLKNWNGLFWTQLARSCAYRLREDLNSAQGALTAVMAWNDGLKPSELNQAMRDVMSFEQAEIARRRASRTDSRDHHDVAHHLYQHLVNECEIATYQEFARLGLAELAIASGTRELAREHCDIAKRQFRKLGCAFGEIEAWVTTARTDPRSLTSARKAINSIPYPTSGVAFAQLSVTRTSSHPLFFA